VSEIMEMPRRWAQRVVDRLEVDLPDMRLLVCLDTTNALTPEPDVRGFFQPNDKHYYRTISWPGYMARALRTINSTGFEATYNYHAVIYLPHRTCNREESLTMTLAHELRHFIQFGFHYRIWAWNGVVTNLKKDTIRERRFAWKDIPIEYEARLHAKRLSEQMLGSRRTAEYIDLKIDEHVTDRDVADWEFVRGLDPSSECNTTAMTKILFQNLADIRGELQESLDDRKRDFPDFRQLDLNEMFPEYEDDVTT